MFMMKNKLEEHMNRVHTEVKVNLDLDKTQSKDCMNEHKNKNHSEDKTFSCTICKIILKKVSGDECSYRRKT